MFLAGLEPATFRVLGGCDNHYTTETTLLRLGLTEHTLSLAPEMHGLNSLKESKFLFFVVSFF